jgi:peptide/nickel transport system ATP-binding protein
MLVKDQLMEVLIIHEGISPEAAYKRASELLDAVRLPDPRRIMSSYPHQLSGGQQQRVIIAMALLSNPKLLLLDEPTTALDIGYQFEIAALLKRLNADHGTTMVVSTHDLNLAAALCERVVLIKSGHVIAHGPTAETLTAHNIRLLYDVDADVQFHERAGHLTVVPLGRT